MGTRALLQYMAPDQDRIDAFLFEPKDRRPSGAVLVLHQHNSQWSIGKSEIAGLVAIRCRHSDQSSHVVA